MYSGLSPEFGVDLRPEEGVWRGGSGRFSQPDQDKGCSRSRWAEGLEYGVQVYGRSGVNSMDPGWGCQVWR